MQLAITGRSRGGVEEGVVPGYTALGNPSSSPSTSQHMSTQLAMSRESVATASFGAMGSAAECEGKNFLKGAACCPGSKGSPGLGVRSVVSSEHHVHTTPA